MSQVPAVQATVDENQVYLKDVNKTVYEVLDLVTPPTYIAAKYAGCDAVDQDDDDEADECDEDQYPPELLPLAAGFSLTDTVGSYELRDRVFTSSEEATKYLKGAVEVIDDCAPESELELVVASASTATCFETFTVTARHNSACGVKDGEIKTFIMNIDQDDPVATCNFGAAGVGSQGGYLFLAKGNEKDFYNTQFTFDLTDDCSESLRVKIRVSSNQNDSNEMATLRAIVTGDETQNQVSVAVSTNPCANSGRYCEHEDGVPRSYKVIVEAKDDVGNTHACTANVIVDLSNNGKDLSNAEMTALVTAVEGGTAPYLVVSSLEMEWKLDNP